MVSVISVATGKYSKFIDGFVKQCSLFTNDIHIYTGKHDKSMGYMRNLMIDNCMHGQIINLDIDDNLISLPQRTADFTGLNWIENGELNSYWIPGTKRDKNYTIRSNFMFMKGISLFPDEDNYTYGFIKSMYQCGAVFTNSVSTCVLYNKTIGTRSHLVNDEQEQRNKAMLKDMEETIENFPSINII